MEVNTLAVDEKTVALYHDAQQIVVTDNDGYNNAGEFLKQIKTLEKEVEATFAPVIAAAVNAHRESLVAKRKHLEPLQDAEKIVKDTMNVYYRDQQRLKAIEEAKIRKEALRQEKLRQEAEKKNKPVPVFKPAPVVQTETPAVKGVSHKSNWMFEITNAKIIPREYLTPDTVKIGKIARALKSEAHIKGVRIWEEKTMAVRG